MKSICYNNLSVSRSCDDKLRFAHLGHVNGTEEITRNIEISKPLQTGKSSKTFDKAGEIKTSAIISENDAQLYKPSRAQVREIIDKKSEELKQN